MSKKIFKYALKGLEIEGVRMPYDSKVLSAQMKDGALFVWAEVETNSVECETVFLTLGTGHDMPDVDMGDYRFVDTVQDGPFVWHIYVEDLNQLHHKFKTV